MPAWVSTTVARAARSWSASHVGRIEGLAIGEVRRHRAHHLGRLVETAQELVDVHPAGGLDRLPAAVDEHETGAALAHLGGGPGRDDRPEPVTGEDDPIVRAVASNPEPSATARTSPAKVAGVVALGRSVGQAVAAQVHRDHVPSGTKPARDRSPGPGRVGQAVDEQDPRPGIDRAGSPAPVQEVDPVARLDDDHEAVRLGGAIRRRHGLHRP